MTINDQLQAIRDAGVLAAIVVDGTLAVPVSVTCSIDGVETDITCDVLGVMGSAADTCISDGHIVTAHVPDDTECDLLRDRLRLCQFIACGRKSEIIAAGLKSFADKYIELATECIQEATFDTESDALERADSAYKSYTRKLKALDPDGKCHDAQKAYLRYDLIMGATDSYASRPILPYDKRLAGRRLAGLRRLVDVGVLTRESAIMMGARILAGMDPCD